MKKQEDNIFWVTETYDNDNYISMQAPGRCFYHMPKKCCFPQPKTCPCEIDFSNKIIVKNETSADIKAGDIVNSTVGTITGGVATGTVTVDACQVSVMVIVPVIDINSGVPFIGQYKVGAAGQNLDIQVNGDGTASINGQKFKETELEDGTKVFIYKSSDVVKNIKTEV